VEAGQQLPIKLGWGEKRHIQGAEKLTEERAPRGGRREGKGGRVSPPAGSVGDEKGKGGFWGFGA